MNQQLSRRSTFKNEAKAKLPNQSAAKPLEPEVIKRLSLKHLGPYMNAKEPIKPWLITKWTSEQSKRMYCNWGRYFLNHLRTNQAFEYFNKSISYGLDRQVLFERSACKREIARADAALDDSILAAELGPANPTYDYEVFRCLLETNKFEDAIIKLYEYLEKYKGNKIYHFRDAIELLHEQFKDQLGDALSMFILSNENIFPFAMKLLKRKRKKIDTRPLWKIQKELNKCDVMSFIEKEEMEISPLEKARRTRLFKVYNQKYFRGAWKDIMFINDLIKHPSFLLKQTQETTPQLRDICCQTYNALRKFMKMYQSRFPMYYNEYIRCPNKDKCDKSREKFLYHIQYQTRRIAIKVLKAVHEYRENNEVKKLEELVEYVLGKYVILKTFRVMPWKFEFINEIINVLGITIAESLQIPRNINRILPRNQILAIFDMLQDKEHKQFVFGDRSTYTDTHIGDLAMAKYKRYIKRFEKRMRFAKYNIEKSYLYYELARVNLENGYFSKCVSLAKLGKYEAKKCGNNLWSFLHVILIIKAHAALQRKELVKDAIEVALRIAKRLKNDRLTTFIEICRETNNIEIDIKNKFRVSAVSPRKRSHLSISMSSHLSLSSNASRTSQGSFTKLTKKYRAK